MGIGGWREGVKVFLFLYQDIPLIISGLICSFQSEYRENGLVDGRLSLRIQCRSGGWVSLTSSSGHN